jgi:thioredoxin 2
VSGTTLPIDDLGIRIPCPSCGRTNRLAFAHLDKTGRCAACKHALASPGHPIEVSSAKAFDQLIAHAPVPVVVDYWAPWCGPCRAVAPELEKLARAQQGRWIVAKVNTDVLSDLGARFGIQSIPTMAVFAGGREIARTTGARPATEIQAFVEQALDAR